MNNKIYFAWILQIWYEVLRDILPDGELLAAPKAPLQLGDILNNGSQEHFSDRDTGESQFTRIQTENYNVCCSAQAKCQVTRNWQLQWNDTEIYEQKCEFRVDHKSSFRSEQMCTQRVIIHVGLRTSIRMTNKTLQIVDHLPQLIVGRLSIKCIE